ncbi:DNA/RNA non-specific endonuclease [Luteolibacter luteus]|uniref:Serine protease n=1 Tax=Luteolibacter luteus TaxID=2728835 RepID=A0A858REC8_9BACT|nr:DNA/RNA non-specific endonuclease [Luteolibacter luteus]QJE94769.1 DNA/RNA endonuclease [Luteolibacter luteus]
MNLRPDQAAEMASVAATPNQAATHRSIRGREIVQGDTTDFLDVSFLETATAVAGTVARVAFHSRRPQGSGFMVSERLFLTNNHVIETPDQARQFVLEFDYQRDYRGQPRQVTRFELDPDSFFLTSQVDKLDYTLIAVGKRIEGKGTLEGYGYCPLLAREDKHVLGELVNIIQHPDGDFKQAVIRENQLVARLPSVLHYVADTNPGASGSLVCNDQWQVIALHHWGAPFTETTGLDGKPVRFDVNEGIRISAILRDMESRSNSLSIPFQQLLKKVVEPTVEYPSSLLSITGRVESAPVEAIQNHGGPAELRPDGSAVWNIPVQIAVNVGSSAPAQRPAPTNGAPVPQTAPPSSPPHNGSSLEAITIDTNYGNRGGYNPSFLDGFTIPLPKLSKTQKEQAAKLKKPDPGADPHELKYTHFSVVLNARRRLAFFTACNIDGTSWINIDRDSGLPKEAAEASEVWYGDRRVEDNDQSDQSLYDKQRPKRLFDRGHMVRRQDPSWGTKKRAIRANADTFHFANCMPQASTFNQSAKFWQGIEQYLLEDNTVADKDRITVFTGPVFDDKRDKTYRYVKVPRQFWKIIVRIQDGQPMAIALLADQSQFLKSIPESISEATGESMEAWDDTTKVDEFLSSVVEIEKLTGLDFGDLRDYDSGTGAEGIKAPLGSFSDIPLSPATLRRSPARPRTSRSRS